MTLDSFDARAAVTVGDRSYDLYRLDKVVGDPHTLPYSLRILLENLLRHEDGENVDADDIGALADRSRAATEAGVRELQFMPARVLMQDFTGVPAIVDLAAMRDAMAELGGDPRLIEPGIPVDLVIDHSIVADVAGVADAFTRNAEFEFARNRERYTFLRWAQAAFRTLRVFPPNRGICHQVNLEYLAQVVFRHESGLVYPDTLVGTDSHTPMVNGLGVLGWGVGGIEAEAAMLGQPLSMLLPRVVGIELVGALPVGSTATDLVLTVAELLRRARRRRQVRRVLRRGRGPGSAREPGHDRQHVARVRLDVHHLPGRRRDAALPARDRTTRRPGRAGRGVREGTGSLARPGGPARLRRDDRVRPVDRRAVARGSGPPPGPSVAAGRAGELRAGAARVPAPRDGVGLDAADRRHARPLRRAVDRVVPRERPARARPPSATSEAPPAGENTRPLLLDRKRCPVKLADGREFELADGHVVIAAITSCTNTSNPSVMIAAGLLARNAVARGLHVPPWVKTSLAPGSLVVTDYYRRAQLLEPLHELGFDVVGYGCTTCIGNSGPLAPEISEAVDHGDLSVASVLSGNRNFEGRIHPDCRMNYLASPPLVVAYALAGTMDIDLSHDPLGHDANGVPVHLHDLWPSEAEVADVVGKVLDRSMFEESYATILDGDEHWRALPAPTGDRYKWDPESTYIRRPTFLEGITAAAPAPRDIDGARVLALLGDSVTTDHISPAGSIRRDGPAGAWLQEHGVAPADFNSYGSRRGNHEVMVRGTFANIRLRNRLAPGTEGGVTVHLPDGAPATIYDAAMTYADEGVPLVVLAGKEYGSGSSRDWAAKGSQLLGIKAVLVESFERIHRSNLVGMGLLPLEFVDGATVASLGLTGHETYRIAGLVDLAGGGPLPRAVTVTADGKEFSMRARIDTPFELAVFLEGGILPYTLRRLVRTTSASS